MAIATVTRPAGALPSVKGAIEATPLRDYFTNILAFLESDSLRGGNVKTTGADDIILTGDVVQDIIALKTFINVAAAAGGIRTVTKFGLNPASGTATDDDGVRVEFFGDNDAGVEKQFASIDVVFSDVTGSSEDTTLVLRVQTGGTIAGAVELTGSAFYPTTDGAITLGSATKKFGSVHLDGTWEKPLVLAGARLWHDETNDVMRVKYGSAPSSETDGRFFSEVS